MNIALAIIDFMTQLLLVLVGIFLVLSPETLVDNVNLGIAPTWTNFLAGDPARHARLHGDRDDLEHGRGGARRAQDHPRGDQARASSPSSRSTRPAVGRPVARCRSRSRPTAVLDAARRAGGARAASRAIRSLGVVKQLDLGIFQQPVEVYVGILAATILFIATNAGIIGVSRLVYSMGMHRQLPDGLRRLHPRYGTPWIGIVDLRHDRVHRPHPRAGGLPGQRLRVRRDAVVHDRPRLRDPAAREGSRTTSGRGGGRGTSRSAATTCRCSRCSAASPRSSRLIVLTVRNPVVSAFGIGWLVFGIGSTSLYRRGQGLDLTSTNKVAVPRPVVEHEAEYESILVAFDSTALQRAAVATAKARGAAAPRHPRARHDHRPRLLADRAPLPAQERPAQELIEQAKVHGGRRVTGRWVKVRAGQAGRRSSRRRATCARRRSSWPSPPRGGATLFSRTVETVLSERPCRVIVVAAPGSARRHDDLVVSAAT